MTMILSLTFITSSSSSETRRTAFPASRCSMSCLWMYSIAPTSRPRTGCTAMTISGLRSSSLAVAEGANLPKGGLDKLFPGASINVGILIAIGCVILIYILLNKTIFGYELKACGMNPDASRYAGINEKRNIVLSMVIAGALSGLGGALLYLANSGKYMQVLDVIAPEGFSGISVALLGLSNPIGILFAGLFIGYITVGGNNMQLFDFAPEVIDIIIAAIIYCGALSLLFKNTIYKFQMRKAKKAEKKSGTDHAGKEG